MVHYFFGRMVGGWLAVESENKAISALDVVEVEAEFGNISISIHPTLVSIVISRIHHPIHCLCILVSINCWICYLNFAQFLDTQSKDFFHMNASKPRQKEHTIHWPTTHSNASLKQTSLIIYSPASDIKNIQCYHIFTFTYLQEMELHQLKMNSEKIPQTPIFFGPIPLTFCTLLLITEASSQ